MNAHDEILEKIEQCYPKRHNYQYNKRLIAYIDILGWEKATSKDTISEKVRQALAIIDQEHAGTTSYFKDRFIENFGEEKMNPLAKEVECGIFSDGILISMPEDFEGRIFQVGEICRKLLAIGFLCRGAITKDYCYHKENRAIGPAINRVVKLEKDWKYLTKDAQIFCTEEEAKFPRIFCDHEITKIANIANAKEPGLKYTVKDPYGFNVLNLFMPGVVPTNEWLLSIEEGLEVEKIRRTIQQNISIFKKDLTEEGNKRLKKWKYMNELMELQLNESIYKGLKSLKNNVKDKNPKCENLWGNIKGWISKLSSTFIS